MSGNYREEFPDFDAHSDMEALLARGGHDVSWHNDACPCVAFGPHGEETLFVFIDYEDRSKGDYPNDASHLRFGTICPEEAGQIASGGNDVNASFATLQEVLDGPLQDVATCDQAAEDALNALALAVQTALGVESGDFAAMYFCDDKARNAIRDFARDYLKAERYAAS